jgi:hypothetical protein
MEIGVLGKLIAGSIIVISGVIRQFWQQQGCRVFPRQLRTKLYVYIEKHLRPLRMTHTHRGTAAALLNMNHGCNAVAKRAAQELIEAARFQVRSGMLRCILGCLTSKSSKNNLPQLVVNVTGVPLRLCNCVYLLTFVSCRWLSRL